MQYRNKASAPVGESSESIEQLKAMIRQQQAVIDALQAERPALLRQLVDSARSKPPGAPPASTALPSQQVSPSIATPPRAPPGISAPARSPEPASIPPTPGHGFDFSSPSGSSKDDAADAFAAFGPLPGTERKPLPSDGAGASAASPSNFSPEVQAMARSERPATAPRSASTSLSQHTVQMGSMGLSTEDESHAAALSASGGASADGSPVRRAFTVKQGQSEAHFPAAPQLTPMSPAARAMADPEAEEQMARTVAAMGGGTYGSPSRSSQFQASRLEHLQRQRDKAAFDTQKSMRQVFGGAPQPSPMASSYGGGGFGGGFGSPAVGGGYGSSAAGYGSGGGYSNAAGYGGGGGFGSPSGYGGAGGYGGGAYGGSSGPSSSPSSRNMFGGGGAAGSSQFGGRTPAGSPMERKPSKPRDEFGGDKIKNISGSGRIERNRPMDRGEYIRLTRSAMEDMPHEQRPIFKFLREGFTVFKIATWTMAGGANRLLWLDTSVPDQPELRWNAGEARDEAAAKRLPLRNIGDLSTGMGSKKLQRRGKQALQTRYMSFKGTSAAGKQISLDLQFSSEDERDWFFNRFHELLHGYAEIFGKFQAGSLEGRDINSEMEKKVDRVRFGQEG